MAKGQRTFEVRRQSPLVGNRNHQPASAWGFGCEIRIIDPSAGSPTETLLRLLLPLSKKVH